jgi:PTH2 family peptidyl-tRNA hydrolase
LVNDIKQVIVIRKDLNMRKGKMIAQGAHASVQVCIDLQSSWCPDYGFESKNARLFDEWYYGGLQTKICVSVDSELELINIYEKARNAGFACSLIKDAGLTEFKEPTFTAVAIGPAKSEEVDKITGGLKLL